jgi:glycosyltransferase involved in cell wall biosynthesis
LSRGGTESQLLELLRGLDRRQVQPHLCVMRRTPAGRDLEPRDCPVLDLGISTFFENFFDLSLGPKVLRLSRYLRANRIEVMHLFFRASTYLGLAAARLARVPKVVRTQNNLGYWMAWYDREKWAFLNRWVDALVVNTREGRDRLSRSQRTDPEKVFILENGLELDKYPPPSRKGNRGLRRVGMVANLRRVKNPELFVRAAAVVGRSRSDVQFAVAGGGELLPRLEALTGELGLSDRCRFLGPVSDVPGFLTELDVAVLCSDSEGLSNSLLEYMAAGLPVVATSVGGNSELIRHGHDGLLVPPGDESRLVEAVGRLLDDPATARRLGANARARVEQRFSREAMVRRFQDFYRRLRGGDGVPEATADDHQENDERPGAGYGPCADGPAVGVVAVGSRAG